MSAPQCPAWFAEAHKVGLVDGAWEWDAVLEEWTVECHDTRFDGSHDLWRVSDHRVELECGSFAAGDDLHGDGVAVMRALTACVDAYNAQVAE